MNDVNIILASQSPRRKELLELMRLSFVAEPSSYDEKLDDSRPAHEVAIELALGKAMTIAKKHPESIVIGSDTIVTLEGMQLEKPKDVEDAYRLLELLSGKENIIVSSLAVVNLKNNIQFTGYDSVKVVFKPYNRVAVEKYVATGDPMDKAAAYGIQSGAAPLIEYMQGDFSTAMGLPTILLNDFLQKLGINSKKIHVNSPVDVRD